MSEILFMLDLLQVLVALLLQLEHQKEGLI